VASKDSRDVIYIAIETGWVELPGGEEFFFRKGVTKVRADHPVMSVSPEL